MFFPLLFLLLTRWLCHVRLLIVLHPMGWSPGMDFEGAVEAHVLWAPLGRLVSAGILEACAYLMTTLDFRMAACDILRAISGRKQATVGRQTERPAHAIGIALTQRVG
jgi:hypothetical protein